MNANEVINKLNNILAKEFEIDESTIKPDANIKDTLMLNSLDVVDMIAVIEYEFGVKIPTDEYAKMKNFEPMYRYVIEHIKN